MSEVSDERLCFLMATVGKTYTSKYSLTFLTERDCAAARRSTLIKVPHAPDQRVIRMISSIQTSPTIRSAVGIAPTCKNNA